MKTNSLAIFIGLLLSLPAQAHTGVGTVHGWVDGLSHPLLGIDHLLVMLAIGLWAAMRGGRSLWLLPMSFLLMMAAGAGLHFAGLTFDAAEAWVAFSVLASGLLGQLSHFFLHGGSFGSRVRPQPRLCSCRRIANRSRCKPLCARISANDCSAACVGSGGRIIGKTPLKNHRRRIWPALRHRGDGPTGRSLSGCMQT